MEKRFAAYGRTVEGRRLHVSFTLRSDETLIRVISARAMSRTLKLSTASISLRLPQALLERIKIAANRRDVPYQSLIKVWLAEKVDAEQ